MTQIKGAGFRRSHKDPDNVALRHLVHGVGRSLTSGHVQSYPSPLCVCSRQPLILCIPRFGDQRGRAAHKTHPSVSLGLAFVSAVRGESMLEQFTQSLAYARARARTHTHTRARARTHTHTHARTRTHTHAHTHTRTHTHTGTHTHTRTRARDSVRGLL